MTGRPARVGVVVGNPKPDSRTLAAAHALVEELGYPVVHSLDLAELGAELLDRSSVRVGRAVDVLRGLDLVVVASPTYKATYTGLLKLFLERFEGGHGLRGVVAVPLMLGGSALHALAGELHLKPLLTEIGASCPTPALFLQDGEEESARGRATWIEAWGPLLHAVLDANLAEAESRSEKQ